MIMESYYDSDEEVCWGPVTAREIKKSLQRPRKAVDRRRTVRMNSPPTKPKHYHDEDMESLAENVSTVSIESKYYTPNATMQKSLQTNFEAKASQILNNTEPEAAISTSLDDSATTMSPENNAILNKLKSSVDYILLGKTEREQEPNTSTNITCIGDNVQDSCLINNFQITLADSYSSDDCENLSNDIEDIIETLDNDLASCNMKRNETKQYFHNVSDSLAKIGNEAEMKDNVIIISDGEDDLSSCDINDSLRYQGTQSQYEDISEVFEDNICTELDNSAGGKEIDNDHDGEDDLSSCGINESLRCRETQSQYVEISEVFEDDIYTELDSSSEDIEKDCIASKMIKNKSDVSCRVNESLRCREVQNAEISEVFEDDIYTELDSYSEEIDKDCIASEMNKNKSEISCRVNESLRCQEEQNEEILEFNISIELDSYSEEIDKDCMASEMIKNRSDISCRVNESLRCREVQNKEILEFNISTELDSYSDEISKDCIASEIIKNKSDVSCRVNESLRCQEVQNEEILKFNISTELESDTEINEVNDHITLEIDVPKICQSANESIDLELNDTLDEINRALEMGLDYSISESVSKQEEETEKKSAEPECTRIDQETHSFNCMASPQLLNKSYKKNVLSEIKSLNDFRNKDNLRNPVTPSIKLHTPLSKVRSNEFKQPLKLPIKSPMPKFQSSLNLKNIKSPIAVYIKNSPSPSLQQNVQSSRISRLPIKTSTPQKTPQKGCKSKISLPSVSYKPAHNALLTKKREIKLPANIERFIPMKPTITKHEERIVNSNRGCKDYISRKLEMDSDLTQSSIDDASLLGMSTQDVSILTSKKAFIS